MWLWLLLLLCVVFVGGGRCSEWMVSGHGEYVSVEEFQGELM